MRDRARERAEDGLQQVSRVPPLIEPNGPYRFGRATVAHLTRWLWRVSVSGAENVPAHGPVILAGTHRSNLDSLLLPSVVDRPVNFMAKKEFFKYRWSDRFFRSLGAFPVHRGEPDKAATARALAVLEAGGVLGIYPEGTRCSGGVVGGLHRGTSWLSARSHAPIVPVGIGGSEAVQPKGKKGVRFPKVRVVFGELLAAPLSRTRRDLEAHTEALQKALQAALDEAGGPGIALP